MIDGHGTPLGLTLSPANRNDSKMLAATLDAISPVRRRRKPGRQTATAPRKAARQQELRPSLLPQRLPQTRHHATHRSPWHRGQQQARPAALKVERTLAWMSRFRRLTIRYERREDIHLAFTVLPADRICLKQIRRCAPYDAHALLWSGRKPLLFA